MSTAIIITRIATPAVIIATGRERGAKDARRLLWRKGFFASLPA